MREEPLHLAPSDLRSEARGHTGVAIEGQLCPVCRWRLENRYDGDFLSFPIERISLSDARRIGIGTFEPGDPKSMSTEQPTGGLDFKAIEAHGSDSHPLALDWTGEFSTSNRGVFEPVEFFKNPAEFRNLFLTMAQGSSGPYGRRGAASRQVPDSDHGADSAEGAYRPPQGAPGGA